MSALQTTGRSGSFGSVEPRSPTNGSNLHGDPHLQHEELQIRRRQEVHDDEVSHIEDHAAKTSATINNIAALQRQLEEHMNNLLDKVQARLDEVESVIDHIDQTETDLLARRSSLRAETEAHFQDIVAQLMTRKEALLREIDECTGKKQLHLSTHRSELDKVRSHLKNGSEFVRESQVDALNQKPQILERLEELRSLPCHLELREDSRIEILADREFLQRTIQNYGEVSGITSVAAHSIATGAGIGDVYSHATNRSQLIYGTPTCFEVQALDTHGKAREEGGDNVTFEFQVHSTFDGSSAVGDNYISDASVVDHSNGTYTCSYTPRVDGNIKLHVRLNGLPVKDSPFAITVLPVNRSIVFADLSPQVNHTARLEHGGAIARQNLQVKTHRVALSKEALPNDRPSWFKIKIHLLHGSSTGQSVNNGWVFLGLSSSTHPKETSHRDQCCYGWAGHGQVWESGVDHNGEQGWKGFIAGDSPVFMYDPISGALAMQNHTNLYTMMVGPPPPTGYFVHANLLGAGDCVELIAAIESDRTYLQENLRVIQSVGSATLGVTANQMTQLSTSRSPRRSLGSNGSVDGNSSIGAASANGSPGSGNYGLRSQAARSPSYLRKTNSPSSANYGNSPRMGSSPSKRNILRPKTQPGGLY